ncbi:MAG TPA: outer membrane beta-barrel protein [Acidobacteriaceae bacterium]|nr:outer membrane beta-barrel protein [Acidobacteriaceae bacterium]
MLKTLIRFGAFAGVLSLATFARSQAMPTATGRGQLQVGAGYTMGKPDYGDEYIGGLAFFGDFDLTQHLGIEADVHLANLHTPYDQAEDTYEVGPRFFWRKNRFTPYGKFMIGRGEFVIQEKEDNIGRSSSGSFMYSFGGGLDINFSHHITVRAFDFEYQKWPNFEAHGLTPAMATVGVAYRFH